MIPEVQIIAEDGKLFVFKNIDKEDKKIFLERCWCVIKNLTVDNILNLSRLWICNKTLGVEYNIELMSLLVDLKNIF